MFLKNPTKISINLKKFDSPPITLVNVQSVGICLWYYKILPHNNILYVAMWYFSGKHVLFTTFYYIGFALCYG